MTPLFIVTLLFATGCSKEIHYDYDSPVYQQLQALSKSQKATRYKALRSRIDHKKQLFTEEYARSGTDHQRTLVALSKKYLYRTLTDTIFPYWYDTRWDYNGTTQSPGEGQIACGYFVTTTLAHAGFRIDRVKLAQQASSKIIQTLCDGYHVIGHNNTKQLKSYMLNQVDGIYIIGLDNHVGFLHKKGNSVTMVHSNGVSGSMKVCEEPIESCKLINNSDAFYIGNLQANDAIYKKWIQQTYIPTAG